MAVLLTDDNGIPVPQYLNPDTGNYELQCGTNGALDLNIKTFLRSLTQLTVSSITPSQDGLTTTTRFAPVGSEDFTAAQIYMESATNIIAAAVIAPVALGARQVEAVLLRKEPTGSDGAKSMSILVEPRINAALPNSWYLLVVTENDAQIPTNVVAGFQFVR